MPPITQSQYPHLLQQTSSSSVSLPQSHHTSVDKENVVPPSSAVSVPPRPLSLIKPVLLHHDQHKTKRLVLGIRDTNIQQQATTITGNSLSVPLPPAPHLQTPQHTKLRPTLKKIRGPAQRGNSEQEQIEEDEEDEEEQQQQQQQQQAAQHNPVSMSPAPTVSPSPSPSPSIPSASTSSSHLSWCLNGVQYIYRADLGAGATSRVYRVEVDTHSLTHLPPNHPIHKTSQRVFALKLLNNPTLSPSAVSSATPALFNVADEIRIMRLVCAANEDEAAHCSHLIQIIDSGFETSINQSWLLLECGDKSLSEYLQYLQHYHLPIQLLNLPFLFRELITCVQQCHGKGVLHRDLKPANFVFVHGRLKLIDFGIAKVMGENNQTEAPATAADHSDCTRVVTDVMLGTINYMSPEALGGDSSDEEEDSEINRNSNNRLYSQHRASDVWSLGCILYQLVYGKPPFHRYSHLPSHKKARIICKEKYPIQFPNNNSHTAAAPTGTKSLPSDPSCMLSPLLLDLLRSCLQRKVPKRATTAQLLAHPYLNQQHTM